MRANQSLYKSIRFYSKVTEKEFVEKFIKMNDDVEFIVSVSDTTKDIGKVVVRFTLFAETGIALKTFECAER